MEKELEKGIEQGLSGLDFSKLDEILKRLSESGEGFFGNGNFLEKLQSLISGGGITGENFFGNFINLIFDGLLGFLPLLSAIVGIAVLASIINSIKPMGNKSTGDLVHFVCYGIIVVILSKVFYDFIATTIDRISILKAAMDIIFPILLTLMAVSGGVVSSGMYQPMVLILSGGVMQIVSSILIPIISLAFIFIILSNITAGVKLDKFSNFFQSIFKWILGTVFTIFMGYLSLNGILGGTRDGISVKTAKYAIKSYVPFLGGFLSEGFDVILASSNLIKNAVGVGGILLIAVIVLGPVIEMAVFSLGLRLASGLIEPISDRRISGLIESSSKVFSLLISVMLAAGFMFIIVCGLIMLTANII